MLNTKSVLFSYVEVIKILSDTLSVDRDLKRESFMSQEVSRPRVSLKAKLHFEQIVLRYLDKYT